MCGTSGARRRCAFISYLCFLVKKVEKKKRNCNRPRYSSGEETLLSRFFYPSILLSLSLSLSLSQPVFFRRSRAGVEWATRGVFFARKASSTRGWAGEGGSRVAAVGAARATSCSITAFFCLCCANRNAFVPGACRCSCVRSTCGLTARCCTQKRLRSGRAPRRSRRS